MRAICLIAFLVSISASASELSKKVDTGTHRPFFWYLNVHASEEHWIKFAGKKYRHVLGYGPTFIEVEKLSAIFFITARGYDRYAHFVSIDGKIDCEIPFSGIADVGSKHGGVSVLSVEWPMVTLESRWSDIIDIFIFDLSKSSYISRRVKEPNQSSTAQRP
jgi:hypothetical protein